MKVNYSPIEKDVGIVNIYCLKINLTKFFFFLIGCICSCGILFVCSYWSPKLKKKLYFKNSSMENATHFLIENKGNCFEITKKTSFRVEGSFEILSSATLLRKKRKKREANLIIFQKVGFHNRHLTYVLDENTNSFQVLQFNFFNQNSEELLTNFEKGLTEKEISWKKKVYGDCLIDIPLPSIPSYIFHEILNPFIIFLIVVLLIWFFYYQYLIFAWVIFIGMMLCIIWNVLLTRGSIKSIRDLARFECKVNVLRLGENLEENKIELSSKDLVPGDLLVIKDGMKMPCDCILFSGKVLVDENVLTGESLPVLKDNIKNSKDVIFYENESIFTQKNYVLFEGTSVLQVNGKCLALVIQIGFCSIKGQLVRSILYPKPSKFNFISESFKFIFVTGIIVICGYLISLPKFIEIMSAKDIILKLIDVITISIPPGIQIAVNIGINFAIKNLAKKNIVCIAPSKVLAGGGTDIVCFDKTGTLTEIDMSFYGFYDFEENILIKNFEEKKKSEKQEFAEDCMGICNSIVQISNENEEKLFGDNMEILLFQITNTKISKNNNNTQKNVFERNKKVIYHFRNFEFTSELQRMSVLSYYENEGFYVFYIKGAPEKIKSLCNEDSVPENYDDVLDCYSEKGMRILALAYKKLSTNFFLEQKKSLVEFERNDFENNLNFLGFVMFENKLKYDASETISILNDANLQSNMVTGDNLLTAVNISHKCGIVPINENIYAISFENDEILMKRIGLNKTVRNSLRTATFELKIQKLGERELILCKNFFEFSKQILELTQEGSYFGFDGKSFDYIFSNQNNENVNFFKKMLKNCRVFARMNPYQKANLIEIFQKYGHIVAMVGDGSNDCGALKQADIGEADAAISSSFSSKNCNVSSIIDLLKILRGGLCTTIQCFQFMCLYGVTQFTTVIILFYNYTFPTDEQFLYIDLITICSLFTTMCLSKPSQELSRKIPEKSLISKKNLFIFIGIFLIQLISQIAAINFLVNEKEFIPNENKNYYLKNNKMNRNSNESVLMFIFSNFIYVNLILSIYIGKPFKEPFYRNVIFVVNVIVLWIYNILLCVFREKVNFGIFYATLSFSSENLIRNVLLTSHLSLVFMFLYKNYICEKIKQINLIN